MQGYVPTYVAGTGVRFRASFTFDGSPADPAQVWFGHTLDGASPVGYLGGAPGSPIVRSGVGLYYAEVDTTGMPAGRLFDVWGAKGGVTVTSERDFVEIIAPTVRITPRPAVVAVATVGDTVAVSDSSGRSLAPGLDAITFKDLATASVAALFYTAHVSDSAQVVDIAAGGGESAVMPVNLQAGTSYTLAGADANGYVGMQSDLPNAVDIPAHSVVPFTVGSSVIIAQLGGGQTSITHDAGVTVEFRSTRLAIDRKGGAVTATQVVQDTWQIDGNLAP